MALVSSTSSPHWLELVSWASQGALVVLTIMAVFAALHQASAFKLFELLKFIQEERFREARRRVVVEIATRRDEQWWEDPALEAAASTCCAHYDIVGNVLIFSGSRALTEHFTKNWADSIVRTYDALHGFIERRSASGGNAYSSYHWLYMRALKHKAGAGGAWPAKRSSKHAGAG